jgi:hypothetical protein
MMGDTGQVSLFYSYTHSDERYRNKLEVHLSSLKRQGLIAGWHDRQITSGSDWGAEIHAQLDSAEIILLLVSADFIHSDFCYSVELQRALERHESGDARVIPVIVRPCDWHTAPFGKLQALPKDGKPVTSWKNRDEAFTDVARGIREAVEKLRSRSSGDQPRQQPSLSNPEELGRRSGLDPESEKRIQLEQRVGYLAANLRLPHPEDRRAAAVALKGIGPKAAAAIPALISALADGDEEVRGSSAEALVKIGPASVPALTPMLQDERPYVRARAAYVLGSFGDAAKTSIPHLIPLLQDEHAGVRRTAADVLGKLGPDAKDAVPHLIRMLQDEDKDAPRYAAEALGRIGPACLSPATKEKPQFDEVLKVSLKGHGAGTAPPPFSTGEPMHLVIDLTLTNLGTYPIFIVSADLRDAPGRHTFTFTDVCNETEPIQPGGRRKGQLNLLYHHPFPRTPRHPRTPEALRQENLWQFRLLRFVCQDGSIFQVETGRGSILTFPAREVCDESFLGWPAFAPQEIIDELGSKTLEDFEEEARAAWERAAGRNTHPRLSAEVRAFYYQDVTNRPGDPIVVCTPHPRRYLAELGITNQSDRPIYIRDITARVGSQAFGRSDGADIIRIEPGEYKEIDESFPVDDNNAPQSGDFEIQILPATGEPVQVVGTFPVTST